MQEDDRRIRRTRRELVAALTELAASHPYESITIRDITDRADVGYATFFRHYGSKDDLMLDIFHNLANGLESMGREHDGAFFEEEGLLLFTYVQENATLFRSILDSLVFTRKLRALITEHTQKSIGLHILPLPDLAIPLDIAVNHMATAVVSLIEWWLEHDLQPSPDQMAQIYDRLAIRGTWHAIQVENPLLLPGEVQAHT
jgi:AcrR family transcriptional regulator